MTLLLSSCTPRIPVTSDGSGGLVPGPVVPPGPSTNTGTFTYKGKNVMDNLGSETGTIKFQAGGGAVELQLWDQLINDFQGKNPGRNRGKRIVLHNCTVIVIIPRLCPLVDKSGELLYNIYVL